MLLVHARRDPQSRYSRYLGEILKTEGFSDVQSVDLDVLDEAVLADAGTVILPRVSLTAAEADRLADWVRAGGKLVALMPDTYLAGRFGLAPTYGAIPTGAGYLWIDTDQELTAGLCPEAVQIVTPAVIWRTKPDAEVTVLADARDETNPSLVAPGVVYAELGKGAAVLFSYDLAHAVARLRQGDPNYADVPIGAMDHFLRPHDLFINQLPARQQRIPQADVHTALLARLIESLSPQPRVWYYPEAAERSLIIQTSDDDWSTLEQFETLLAGLAKRDATCTFYMVQDTHITGEQMTEWEKAGHTFSVHPSMKADYRAAPPIDAPQRTFIEEMMRENAERHTREFGRPVRTIRNHAIRWAGYVDAAKMIEKLGARLECNYVSVNPLFLGHLCGTGRAMRFVDVDGSIIDVFQQPTHWTEEALVHASHSGGAHWQFPRAIHETNAVIRAAARTFYTPICINSHPVSFHTYSSPLIEANWDEARSEGMRIISADRWLDWTETREGITVSPDGDGWSVEAAAVTEAVTVLFPAGSGAVADGAEASEQVLWGKPYTAVTLRGLAAGEKRAVRGGVAVASA